MRSAANVLIFTIALVSAIGSGSAWTPSEENTIRVYEKVLPSVVTLVADGFPDSELKEMNRNVALGSGFAIRTGLVVTNYHVIEMAERIRIYLHDGRSAYASVLGTAPEFDLALLRVPFGDEELPPSQLGTIDGLRVGQKILTISSPLGLHHSVTVGVVSSLYRDLPDLGIGENLIQFDAALNPGQSGGPLVDSGGMVIGVTTAKAYPAESIGFAIPIDIVVNIVPDLETMGHIFRPQLGMSGTAITPQLAVLLDLPVDHGMIVEAVNPGGIAEKAGLKPGIRHVYIGGRDYVLGGDILVALNGVTLRNSGDLLLRLLSSRPGETLRFNVKRGSAEVLIQMQVPEMKH